MSPRLLYPFFHVSSNPSRVEESTVLIVDCNSQISKFSYDGCIECHEYIASRTPILPQNIGAESGVLGKMPVREADPSQEDLHEMEILILYPRTGGMRHRLTIFVIPRDKSSGQPWPVWERKTRPSGARTRLLAKLYPPSYSRLPIPAPDAVIWIYGKITACRGVHVESGRRVHLWGVRKEVNVYLNSERP